jgi:3-hydroxyisobutyrate dehydrogenase
MTTNPNSININGIDYTIEDLEKDCWHRLLNGALRSKDPFHTASVATWTGTDISLRTMVLRKAKPQDQTLIFHTDTRSPKCQQLKQYPSLSILFYDAVARIQIRVKGIATLHHDDDLANDAWQQTALHSRRSYLTTAAPSTPTIFPTSGLPETFELTDLTETASEAGKPNFGVIVLQVESMDWLWLHHAGHRRAFFDYHSKLFSWLIP